MLLDKYKNFQGCTSYRGFNIYCFQSNGQKIVLLHKHEDDVVGEFFSFERCKQYVDNLLEE